MLVRFFLNFFRFLLFLVIAVLLLLLFAYAILQTKWAKEKIREQLSTYLNKLDIHGSLEEVDGQLPFTWTLKEADLHWGNDQECLMKEIKLRIAILPLLYEKIVIDYLHIQEAILYLSSGSSEISSTEPLKEWRGVLKEQIDTISLPFALSIQHLTISQLTLVNKDTGAQFVTVFDGMADLSQDRHLFSLDFRLSSIETHEISLEATLRGDQSQDWIETDLKIHFDELPPLLPWQIAGKIAFEFHVQGAWASWEDLLSGASLTKGPLRGEVKGVLADTKISELPLLERTWKCKAHFSFLSSDEIYIEKFLLSSDLLSIKGKGVWNQNLIDSRIACGFSLPDLSLFSPSVGFSLSGAAEGKGLFQEGNLKVSFLTHELHVDEFAAMSTQGLLKGSIFAEECEGEVHLFSSDAQIPFASTFAFEYTPNLQFSVIDFSLELDDAAVTGYVNYQIQKHLYDGALFANAAHLNRFSLLFKEEIPDGSVALECRVSSEDETQNIRCVALGKNFRYQDMLLDDFTFSFEIDDLFDERRGKFNLLVEKFFSPRLYLTRLNFGTYSDEEEWPFFLDAEGRMESPFQTYAKGSWARQNKIFELELTEFFGKLAEAPFSLKFPTFLEWSPTYLNLSPFELKIGYGSLYTAFELSSVRSLGVWELKHFPLELFSCIRPRLTLKGSLSSSGHFDANPENLEGTLHAVLEDAGILHFGKKDPLRARGSMQTHFDQGRAQIHTDLHATGAQFLDFNATLPFHYTLYPFSLSFDTEQNTSAELIAEGKVEDLFDFINLGSNGFTGLISTRLFLSQTLAHPSLQGKLEWLNGSFDNYFVGISLKEIDAQFEAENDTIELLQLTASDGKEGALSMQGHIDLKPQEHFPYAFEAELDQLKAVGFDMIDCDLTGPLYLTGDTHNMTAQGNLIVAEALIQVTERLPYETPSLPVTYINRPTYLSQGTQVMGSPFAFHIDLDLSADGNILAKGSGLNAELGGHVHVAGTNTNIAASGTLELITGEYQFSGKIFKLTEGEIIFNDKPTPSAYLNLNGTLSMPDATITAMLRGPLTSPQLSFQSNPHMPTSSILALILFNKDISDISHPEAVQLATTLMSLSGGAGPDMMDTIRKTIGIDRLNIAPHPGSDEIALQIGKYLTRGVMITLSQSPTSSQVIVEVELPKGFVFQAETQEQQEGKFSLKWTKSY